jgi:hypothetical protein
MVLMTIIQAGVDAMKKAGTLPLRIRIAAGRILKCRTSELGGHKQVCPDGHFERVWWNSCRHRFCPQCGLPAIERWLARQKARLLRCDHYHVVFTMPAELDPLWVLNPREMSGILFKVVHSTLKDLLGDPKHLGARAGVIAALHTWGQMLVRHPHLHCLVTGGGLTKSGEWKPVRNGYLLSVSVVREVYAKRMLAMIREELGAGRLRVPEGQQVDTWQRITVKLGGKKWNVNIRERYAHGTGIATYLARYLRGTPIKSQRIISWNGDQVRFSYIDNRATKEAPSGSKVRRIMQLSTTEFVLRLFQHLPEPNMKLVRHWGLYGPQCREQLDQCRELLGQAPVEETPELGWKDLCDRLGPMHPECCPTCGQRLVDGPLVSPVTRLWSLKLPQKAA